MNTGKIKIPEWAWLKAYRLSYPKNPYPTDDELGTKQQASPAFVALASHIAEHEKEVDPVKRKARAICEKLSEGRGNFLNGWHDESLPMKATMEALKMPKMKDPDTLIENGIWECSFVEGEAT